MKTSILVQESYNRSLEKFQRVYDSYNRSLEKFQRVYDYINERIKDACLKGEFYCDITLEEIEIIDKEAIKSYPSTFDCRKDYKFLNAYLSRCLQIDGFGVQNLGDTYHISW